MWEQGLPAIQALGYPVNRVSFIAGKPCSHRISRHGVCLTPQGSPLHRILHWVLMATAPPTP
ncbi:hypothetical protein FGE05_09975 [Pseudomonas sp. ICMP22404]|nr:hypothetical protein FGE05_09975 [Pseudomonas sp. ICMP22404]